MWSGKSQGRQESHDFCSKQHASLITSISSQRMIARFFVSIPSKRIDFVIAPPTKY
jgi:hypothetical protein